MAGERVAGEAGGPGDASTRPGASWGRGVLGHPGVGCERATQAAPDPESVMASKPARRVPRPAPLSDAAKKARAPTPPEELVAARQDRVHVEKGKLIAAVPLNVEPTVRCVIYR